MTKCDYCDNESVGNCGQKTIHYCDDHYKEAKESEKRFVKALEEWEEYKEDKYWRTK